MQKNVADQTWAVFAFGGANHSTPGDPITGDAANITATIARGTRNPVALTDTTPNDRGGGYYVFTLTADETDDDRLTLIPVSATPDVLVVATPASLYTTPPDFSALSIVNGGITLEAKTHTGAVVPTVSTLTGHTPQTGDSFPGVGDIQGRLPAALSSGRMASDAQALNDDTVAAANLASGARQLRPFVVGASASATSIPTDITGAPYTTTDHFRGRVVTINEETKTILGSSGSPVVLAVQDFVSVPSQGEAGVIS